LLIRRSPAWSLPVLVDSCTIPYGLTSPSAGTVEPTVDTVFSPARNGLGVVVAVVVAAADVVAEAALDVVPLLAALPQPAIASAATGAASIAFPKVNFILTGSVLSVSELCG
jgi:hypothetical protein